MSKVRSVRTLNHGRPQIVHYYHKPISMIGVCVVLVLIQVSYSRVRPLFEVKSMPELGWKTKQGGFSQRSEEQLEVSFMIDFEPAQSRFALSKESETLESPSPFSGEVMIISESAVEDNSMETPFSIQLQSKRIGRQEEDRLPKRNDMSYGVNFEERRKNQLKENSFQKGLYLSNLQNIADKLTSNLLQNRIQTLLHLKKLRRSLQYKKGSLIGADPFLAGEPKHEFDIESQLKRSLPDQAIETPKKQRETNPYEDLEGKAGSNLTSEIYKLDRLRMPEKYQRDEEAKLQNKDQSLPDLSGEEVQQITI